MRRLRWSSLALGRAAEIVDYIARDRPQAALDWILGLEQRVLSLVELPMQGHEVPEWAEPSLRQVIYREHRIIYEVDDHVIDILTIKHGRQHMGSKRQELHATDR